MEGKRPPIDAQNVIDLVFDATAFSSSDSRVHLLGEKLFTDHLCRLFEQYKGDPVALQYLNSLVAVLGSTLRAFAVEKLNYKRRILPLERIRDYEEKAIQDFIGALPLLPASTDGGKWSRRFAMSMLGLLSLGIGTGTALIGAVRLLELIATAGLALLVASAIIYLFSLIVRWLLRREMSRLASQAARELDTYWGDSYKRYEAALMDCLIGAIRLQEEFYPNIKTFYDGHLFPRREFPVLPPSTIGQLNPSPVSASVMLSRLVDIIRSRISINPKMDKLEWLRKFVTRPVTID